MLKQILMGLCTLAFVGAGYTAVIAADSTPAVDTSASCSACDSTAKEQGEQTVILAAAESAPAATKTAATDVKNTKCLVMPDDDAGDKTVEHKGKIYHFCCGACVKKFKADPDKYIKALEADPAKFGVK